MDTQSTTPRPFNLQTRVMNILTRPKEEWPVIAAEPRDVAGLYSKYIAILAAIPAICTAIGSVVIGVSIGFGFGYYRTPIVGAVISAILHYVVTLIAVYISALIVAKLGPSFQSDTDIAQALKLVAYAYTPVWIAGVLYIIPLLGLLVLFAWLYSLYLWYLGATPVMKTPPDKVIPYMVVSIIVTFVVSLVFVFIAGAIIATLGFGMAAAARGGF